MYSCNFYKICNSENEKIYVGSTKQKLHNRFATHKYCSRNESGATLHKHMREIGTEKFYIELIETKDVASREQQLKYETKYIVDLKAELNQRRGCISYEEKLELTRKWKSEHPEQVKTANNKWRKKNKQVLNEKKRLYYQKNKQVLNEKQRLRYQKNKKLLGEKIKTQIDDKIAV